jgi:hypothetical protein
VPYLYLHVVLLEYNAEISQTVAEFFTFCLIYGIASGTGRITLIVENDAEFAFWKIQLGTRLAAALIARLRAPPSPA